MFLLESKSVTVHMSQGGSLLINSQASVIRFIVQFIVLLMTGAKTRVLVKCQQPTKKPATLRSEQSAFGGKSVK